MVIYKLNSTIRTSAYVANHQLNVIDLTYAVILVKRKINPINPKSITGVLHTIKNFSNNSSVPSFNLREMTKTQSIPPKLTLEKTLKNKKIKEHSEHLCALPPQKSKPKYIFIKKK